MYLSEQDNISMSSVELSELCEVEEEEILKRMTYWVAKGVVRECYSSGSGGDSSSGGGGGQGVYYEIIEEQALLALRDQDEVSAGQMGGDSDDGLQVFMCV